MKTTNERLKYLIEEVLKITPYEFSKSIGNNRPDNIYNNLKDNPTAVTTKTIDKIVAAYPRVRRSWLIDGELPIYNNGEVLTIQKSENSIPMYNFPVAAGGVETYIDPNDVKVVGHLNIPGAHKDSVAIPAYGDSMYPTLSNGDWAVSRPISDPTEIVWGELYYVEWSDYKMYKRLLHAENEDEVVLWSDNQQELIGDRPKFAAMIIKKEKIRKLRLVTEILKKPNY